MNLYLTLKWLHIVSIICWMAGILYLVRLFIYHRENGVENPPVASLFTIMERKLYRGITVPSMISAWICGLGLIYIQPGILRMGWLHGKLLCVVLLTASTLYCGLLRQGFLRDPSAMPSGRNLRIFNEFPAVLMVIIVGLVVFKCSLV